MKFNLLYPPVLISTALSACTSSEPGTPMEFAKACAVENDKKRVEMSGFLSPGRTVFCSNRSGRMECGYGFAEKPDAGQGITAYIEQGTGVNSVEKLKSSYQREDVRVRDQGGNLVNLADKLKLTGKLSVTPDLSACFINVIRIER